MYLEKIHKSVLDYGLAGHLGKEFGHGQLHHIPGSIRPRPMFIMDGNWEQF